MHNTSGPVPEFIPINGNGDEVVVNGAASRPFNHTQHSKHHHPKGFGRGSTSSRGHYGPPKTGRGMVASPPQRPFSSTTEASAHRTKRKREGTSADRRLNGTISTEQKDHKTHFNGTMKEEAAAILERMPWHPLTVQRYSEDIIGLHEEIEDFFQWIVPTVKEHNQRLKVVDRVRKAIVNVYPRSRVEIFGSFRTGLYLPTSDIDLVLCGKWSQLPFGDLSDALQGSNVALPGSLKVLERAAVPIIKMADSHTGIKVDISFNMANGLRAAELIKHFKKRYPALPKLIYVLKQFLRQRDLNEVYIGGLSSYALILMVVSFLQQHAREDARTTKANLGVLLVEFFELYGVHFNYTQTAIRITDDGAYLRKDETPCYQGGGFGTICIEDPYDANNDVGKSSYGFPTVKKTFEHAYFHLLQFVTPGSNPPENGRSILNQIIRVSDEVVDFRRSIATKNGSLSGADFSEDLERTPDDPMPPLASSIWASSKDVTPRELPDRFFSVPSPQPPRDKTNSTKADNNVKPVTTTSSTKPLKNTQEDNMSDNMSGVSMATSSLTSEDTDSDLLIPNGQATPNSAMSISPATSEVGSFLNTLRGGTDQGSTFKPLAPNRNNRGKAAARQPRVPQVQVDRADLDLDWRSTNGSSSKPLSADQDTNWRDHKPASPTSVEERPGSTSPWRLNCKSRKLQDGSDNSSEDDEENKQNNNKDNDNDNDEIHIGNNAADNNEAKKAAASVAITAAKCISGECDNEKKSVSKVNKKLTTTSGETKRKRQGRHPPASTRTSTGKAQHNHEEVLNTTSSKDTSTTTAAESDNNVAHNSGTDPEARSRVSRVSGQVESKR